MVPVDESSFALVGGAHMKQGRFQNIEVYKVIDSTNDTICAGVKLSFFKGTGQALFRVVF